MKKIYKDFRSFKKRIKILFLLDHGGRGGSNFFQCLFDNHENIIVCPLVHYVYSNWTRFLGKKTSVSIRKFYDYLEKNSYFKYIYNDLNDSSRSFIKKIGGDTSIDFPSKNFRNFIEYANKNSKTISRSDAIKQLYFFYAVCINKNTEKLNYILCIDSVSLREERLFDSFDLSILDLVKKDFIDFYIISIQRDPRAQFASTRHQLISQMINNYDYKISSFFHKFFNLLLKKYKSFDAPANFFIFYQYIAFYSLLKKYENSNDKWIFIKNEDLNINFLETIKKFCKKININFCQDWDSSNYKIKMMGKEWNGTGAYNSNYNPNKSKILSNELKKQGQDYSSPNKHVTQRWKYLLPWTEKLFLTNFFYTELKISNYELYNSRKIDFIFLIFPFLGEIPRISWFIKKSENIGFIDKLFYLLTFPLFFFVSRIKILIYMYVLKKKYPISNFKKIYFL